MATTALPKFVVLDVPKAATKTYVYRKDDGSVIAGVDSVFSPLVKVEVERATVDNKYVHLRFSNNNKYWQTNADDDSIVAVSNKPEEDTTKPSCTLFEPTLQSDKLYFTHVRTGWRVTMKNSTKAFYVDKNSAGVPLGFVNWGTLVRLPEHVAFKGNNGKYLQAYNHHGYHHMNFGSDDANDDFSGHTVSLMPDGHVRIKSDYWGQFWRRSPYWVTADTDDVTANNKDTLFWPIKIDANNIALINAGNNKFLKGISLDWKYDCLMADVSTKTNETIMQVQELVTERKIYNVRYRMKDARIFGETPFLAGKTRLTNDTDKEDSMTVSITYQDEKSYSYSRGVSVTAGVKTTIEAGVPFVAKGEIEVSFEISTSLQWDTTTKTTISTTASGTVPVPARSMAVVDFVGTKGTCNVPFSYTQEDHSSTSGAIVLSEQIDGIYEGVSYYNFDFRVTSVKSI